MNTKSAVIGAVGSLLLGGMSLSACSTAPPATAAPSVTAVTAAEPTTPCAEEDSPGPCFWDAKTMGNKGGRSFYIDAAQVIHYKD